MTAKGSHRLSSGWPCALTSPGGQDLRRKRANRNSRAAGGAGGAATEPRLTLQLESPEGHPASQPARGQASQPTDKRGRNQPRR